MLDALLLARWQFAITTVYHFLFVPSTLGLSIMTAMIQTKYYRTGDPKYKTRRNSGENSSLLTLSWGSSLVLFRNSSSG